MIYLQQIDENFYPRVLTNLPNYQNVISEWKKL